MSKTSPASLDFRQFSQGAPLYEAVKQYFEERIRTGALVPNDRIPSENEIVADFGVSRMTANRALRELAAAGKIVRVHGVGSFVAEPKPSSTLLDVRNIADEIRERGHHHEVRVALLEACKATPVLQDAFGLGARAKLYHSVMIHLENGMPIQIENRYVNPAIAPDYLKQDFSQQTANVYLTQCAAITNIDVSVEAVLPSEDEAAQLQIAASEPCLRLQRRTWNNDRVVTVVFALHPGSRFRFEGTAR